MAKVNKSIYQDDDLTVMRLSGKVIASYLAKTLNDFYSSDFTSNILWDLSEADLSEITATNIKEIIFVSKKHAHNRPKGRSAIVVSKDVDFGLSRMYETLSEVNDIPISYAVFRDQEEAMKWLRSEQQVND